MHALVIGAQARQLGLYVELCLCPRHARSASIRSGMHALVIGAQARQMGLYVELCLCPRRDMHALRMRRDRGSQVSSRILVFRHNC